MEQSKELENRVVKPEVSIMANDESKRLISIESETEMDNFISQFENFVSENTGVDKTEEEKDELYASAQIYILDLRNKLKDLKSNFYFNRKQYQFLTNLILQKMEYDVNTVFVALELKELMLNMRDVKFSNDKDLDLVEMTPTEVTYLYHIISTHKVRGLTDDAYNFANVLRRIGEVSKIINYYDAAVKRLSTELSTWAVNMGGGELLSEVDDTVQPMTLVSSNDISTKDHDEVVEKSIN